MAWCRTRIYISRLYFFAKSADLPVVSFLHGWVGSYENNCFGSNVNTLIFQVRYLIIISNQLDTLYLTRETWQQLICQQDT